MSARKKPRSEMFECPNCGADVAVGAKACRECGSDALTGWQSSEEIDYQSLDLPEGHATHDEHPGGAVPSKTRTWIVVTAAVLVVVLIALWTGVLR